MHRLQDARGGSGSGTEAQEKTYHGDGMTTPIAPWIMAAATRIFLELHDIQEEGARVARLDGTESGYQHVIGSLSHIIWVESQRAKEAAK